MRKVEIAVSHQLGGTPGPGRIAIDQIEAIQLFSPTPTPTPTSSPSSGPLGRRLGKLSVRVPETCKNKSFTIRTGDLEIGNGQVNTDTLVGAGTYDIVLRSDFLNSITKTGVEVQEGEEAIIDLTNELGAIRLIGYPALEKPVWFYANAEGGNTYLLVGEQYCATLGTQKIMLLSSHTEPYGIYGTRLVTDGVFESTEMKFTVEVNSTQQTVVGPEQWPKQLGLLSFDPPHERGLSFRVIGTAAGAQPAFPSYGTNSYVWIPVGTYKIVMSDPYPGLTFDTVEIARGRETVLHLPVPSGSPTPTISATQTASPSPLAPTQPVASRTPITPKTSPGTGILDVQVTLEGCNRMNFEIKDNDRVTGTGHVGEEMPVAAGTYTIVLKSGFGNEPAKQGVVIGRDQPTRVDFTQEIGKLRINGYPQIGGPSWAVSPGTGMGLVSDYDQCGPAGTYDIAFSAATIIVFPSLRRFSRPTLRSNFKSEFGQAKQQSWSRLPGPINWAE